MPSMTFWLTLLQNKFGINFNCPLPLYYKIKTLKGLHFFGKTVDICSVNQIQGEQWSEMH